MRLNELLDQATPPPWTAYLNVPGAMIPGHIIKTDEDQNTPIAALWEGGGTKGKPRQEANALLIAHAVSVLPDLVNALQAALSQLTEDREEYLEQDIEQIKQALALAEQVKNGVGGYRI